jgi:hypothetical protein
MVPLLGVVWNYAELAAKRSLLAIAREDSCNYAVNIQ